MRFSLLQCTSPLVARLRGAGGIGPCPSPGAKRKTFTRSELGAHNRECALLHGTRLLAAVQKGRRGRVSEHLTDNLRHLSR
jgi:hypothetical protein